MRSFRLAGLAALCLVTPAAAQRSVPEQVPEQIVVFGTLPASGIGLAPDKVPGTLQSLWAAGITAGHGATVLDSLGSRAPGVSLSDSQGNAMFQDLRFHGFEASPLQGT